ncbi:MAG: hypothetical protein ACPL7I_05125, partial [Myxococcota bacterium]
MAGICMIILSILLSLILIKPDIENLKRVITFAFIMFFPVFLFIPFIPDKSDAFFDLSRFYSADVLFTTLSLFLKG